MEEAPLRSSGRWLIVLLWVWLPLLAQARGKATPAPPLPAGSLKGVVVGPDRAPIAGASVTLTPALAPAHPGEAPPAAGSGAPGLSPLESITNEQGGFRFQAIPAGEYILGCGREGFLPYEGETVRIENRPHPDVVVILRLPPGAGEGEEPELERLRRLREQAPPSVEQLPGGAPSFPGAQGVPLPDRWRIPLPDWDRYPGRGVMDNPFRKRSRIDPYDQNPLKGDYPVIGQNVFVNLTAVADTFFEARRLPTPSGQSAAGTDPEDFFGDNDQKAGAENLLLSFEMFRGNAGLRPVDWRIRLTAGLNSNYLAVRERGVVNIDVREGTDRTDEHIGAQELFGEVKLGDIGTRYDFVSVRAGIQSFLSDFRGFIFLDNQPGVRIFGSFAANRGQWNLAGFEMLEKDTNSGLNTTHLRNQRVGVANLFIQDFPVPGYTLEGSLHANVDRAGSRDPEGGFHYDENGFLVRPAAVGDFKPHDLRAFYVGLTGDGHFGRLNLTNAVYLVRGQDDHNPIAGREVRIRATMAAVELSIDRNWLRYRASMFFASGDEDARDRVATGFDSILDNPNFAGGAASFYVRQGIRLTGTNVGVNGRFSLVPDLRSSKDEGQANFVNPGLFLYNVGLDAEVTPKLKIATNVDYLRFDTTEVLENLLFQSNIDRPFGFDGSVALVYRPTLIDNVILTGGLAVFRPCPGFRDIFQESTLFSAFAAITLTY